MELFNVIFNRVAKVIFSCQNRDFDLSFKSIQVWILD